MRSSQTMKRCAFFCIVCSSYDSHLDYSRDNKKNKFANTMAFMEEYLNNVLIDDLPFANEEKNKLTYEVHSCPTYFLLTTYKEIFNHNWIIQNDMNQFKTIKRQTNKN